MSVNCVEVRSSASDWITVAFGIVFFAASNVAALRSVTITPVVPAVIRMILFFKGAAFSFGKFGMMVHLS